MVTISGTHLLMFPRGILTTHCCGPLGEERAPGEKRNATEIMHAYLGTGIEILNDKGAALTAAGDE